MTRETERWEVRTKHRLKEKQMFDIAKLKDVLIKNGNFTECVKLQIAVDRAKTQRGIQIAAKRACRSIGLRYSEVRIQGELI